MAFKNWSREELLVAFNLYCRTPFGKLHHSNPEIIYLAALIGRSPSALTMKLVNFASLDPFHQKRNVKGLRNASKADHAIWDEFHADWGGLVYESYIALKKITDSPVQQTLQDQVDPQAPTPNMKQTEAEAVIRIRLQQDFFRESILSSYNSNCAFCGLDVPPLLNASHIIPWSKNIKTRLDPTNGICLCALHDRAFDRGFISIDTDFKILLSHKLSSEADCPLFNVAFSSISGADMRMPGKFPPNPDALEYHRSAIFLT